MYKYLLIICAVFIGTLNTNVFADTLDESVPRSVPENTNESDPTEGMIELSPEQAFEKLSE